ncbi:delta-class carbonic anhydrase [Pseudooceanicola sp. LIPI14-2-Ac024]|uniref:delta-class carbonic anhydrase n=1 Tax=Pseudooceanicola sp. LIPI14-2-Ac024 TaxID=3344875 RepID=UPI0035CF586C
MPMRSVLICAALLLPVATSAETPGPPAKDGPLCLGYGPQAPRDIRSTAGLNAVRFAKAPPPEAMNLCNIHTHTNAEHAGPGFAIPAADGGRGGFLCAGLEALTPAQLVDPEGAHVDPHGYAPGDTIEVHWVYSSCDVTPGEGLGACLSDTCGNPQLRVEAQVFLLVNDARAMNFLDFDHDRRRVAGRPQPRALPSGTGDPVVYPGSTTGPSYTQAACSPLQVTWSVRPDCAMLDIGSLRNWVGRNVFHEHHSHGVRALVTAAELLAPLGMD